jgi:hypothetical protein
MGTKVGPVAAPPFLCFFTSPDSPIRSWLSGLSSFEEPSERSHLPIPDS